MGIAGHSLDGLYLVQNVDNNQIQTVFCSFGTSGKFEYGKISKTKINFVQKNSSCPQLIGNVDVKTTNVHFYVQRKSSFTTPYAVIPFESEVLNLGNGMDSNTGVFTAPLAGTYYFQFSGITNNNLEILLQVNGQNIALSAIDLSFTNGASFYTGVTLTASVQLKANDQVNLYNNGDGELYQPGAGVDVPNTHFTGWLVDEDL